MSLRIFHIIFIAVCLALCIFMVRWGYVQGTTQGWVVAGVFLVSAAALLVYGKKILQKFKDLPALALIVALTLVLAPSASACPVCYGAPGDPLVRGSNNGIAVLLGIIILVQIGFAALFFSFWRRSRALKRRREQFHLIEGGAR